MRATKHRRIAAFLAAIGLSATIVTAGAAPANAAGRESFTLATACIQSYSVMYGHVYWGPFTETVYVDAWFNGSWQAITTVQPGSRGCLTTALVPGYYWRLSVNYKDPRTPRHFGTTGYYYARGGDSVNFGTLYLRQV